MTVVVAGGGITGLAAAYELGRAGVPTVLLEASQWLGGKVRTERVDGFLIESGPDSFVSYRPAAMQLIDELGLRQAVIRPSEPRTVHIWARDRLVPMPEGLDLVLPTRFGPFLASPLFTPLQKARMGLDLLLPRGGSTGAAGGRREAAGTGQEAVIDSDEAAGDVAIGPFLRRRLGRALVDRLAGPLVGGIYGTAIDDLSLDAVLPQLRQAEREHRSLILAALESRRARERARRMDVAPAGARGAQASPFISLAGGTGQLADALAAAVTQLPSVSVRMGAAVRQVTWKRSGVEVALGDGDRLEAEGLVIAVPAAAAAAILSDAAPAVVTPLHAIPYGSTIVVSLAYAAADVDVSGAGHGFLVAQDAELTMSACTVSSSKWPGRAPAGGVLLRGFIGDGSKALADATDEAVAGRIRDDLRRTLRIDAEPLLVRVARWPAAMPHYTVGHLARVAAAERALADLPGIVLAGSPYRGVGLPDCIGQGRAAGRALAERLGAIEAAA